MSTQVYACKVCYKLSGGKHMACSILVESTAQVQVLWPRKMALSQFFLPSGCLDCQRDAHNEKRSVFVVTKLSIHLREPSLALGLQCLSIVRKSDPTTSWITWSTKRIHKPWYGTIRFGSWRHDKPTHSLAHTNAALSFFVIRTLTPRQPTTTLVALC